MFCFVAVSILLVGGGWYAHGVYDGHYGRRASRRVQAAGFRFISPLLDVELPEGVNVRLEPIPFKYKINNFVQQQLDAKRADSISVYFRDLADGPWFGINENVRFNPASMMKVPVMVAWLKRAEKEPGILKQTFAYDGARDLTEMQGLKPRQTLVPGHRYTVDELLRFMMNYSDNNATALLYYALSDKELNDVLGGMDVDNDPSSGGNAISVHGYSGFFRILYNAAYLNREMSERALQLLTLQDFPQGIAAGVPKGVAVAAKFGEDVQGEEKQLHEFGIVYHPNGPYILGVMTRGHDMEVQSGLIRDISRMVYAEVSSVDSLRKQTK